MFHHRQIMRNKQKSYFRFLLNILKQIHNLRLYTDIQRGHRFIRHDEARIHRQRARDTDPLPLSAAELVRIPPGMFRFQTDLTQQFGNPFRPAGLIQLRMQLQRLLQRAVYAHPRIQRSIGVLKNHLETAAHFPQFPAVQ